MRIVCDNCGAKYQIADEKVRNKVFKIRCKRCSHVVVVRAEQKSAPASEPEAAVAPPAEDEATKVVNYADVQGAPSAAEPPPDAIWFAVINREQAGPLTPAQVEGHFEAGDINADTFVWAEGMGDWMRLDAIAEFASLVAPPAAAPVEVEQAPVVEAPAAPEPAPSFDVEPSGDDDVMASDHADAPESAGLFGDEPDEGPRVSAAQLHNQRNENSVLFSLDSLGLAGDDLPGVANTGGSEGSGLIDISALGGAPGGASEDAYGGGFAPVSAGAVGAAPMPTFVTGKQSNTGKIALMVMGGLLLLAAGVGGTLYLMREDPTATPVVATAPQKEAPAKVVLGSEAKASAKAADPKAAAKTATPDAGTAVATAKAVDAGTKPEAKETVVATAKPKKKARRTYRPKRRAPARANPEDAPSRTVAAPAPRPKPKPKPKRRAKPEKTDELDDLLGGIGEKRPAQGGRAAASAAPAVDPMLPEKLSRKQILTVVKRNARSIKGCKQIKPDVKGTIKVAMVIGRSGSVTSAKAGGSFAGTPIGRCVESKVRAFKFTRFSGPPMRINMPFAL